MLKPLLISLFITFLLFTQNVNANTYDRNKAVPVEKVLFGSVISVRNVSQQELIEDRNSGWKTFGGALVGGVIGNQFGGGSGRDIATILGAVIGGSIVHNNQGQGQVVVTNLVELMIEVECASSQCQQYMVIQDYDQSMVFHKQDAVRMVYLANGMVRIDKQF